MMSLSENVIRAQAVTQELNDVLKLFDISKNNSDITTSSGRTYKVANVCQNKNDRSWTVTHLVSRGMFACKSCGDDIEPKFFAADAWKQFTHGEDTVRMHSRLIHQFNEHPEHVSSETLEEAARVFLG